MLSELHLYLFPEIYVPTKKKEIINDVNYPGKTFEYETFSLHHGPAYSKYPELQKLLKNMVSQENDKISSCEDYINQLQEILIKYPDYEKYLAEDRLASFVKDVAANDGVKAFKEIEIELLRFNQKLESVSNKLRASI